MRFICNLCMGFQAYEACADHFFWEGKPVRTPPWLVALIYAYRDVDTVALYECDLLHIILLLPMVSGFCTLNNSHVRMGEGCDSMSSWRAHSARERPVSSDMNGTLYSDVLRIPSCTTDIRSGEKKWQEV